MNVSLVDCLSFILYAKHLNINVKWLNYSCIQAFVINKFCYVNVHFLGRINFHLNGTLEDSDVLDI